MQLPITALELRERLRKSKALVECSNPGETDFILSSEEEYAESDCVFLFAYEYDQNVCVHFHYGNSVRYCHTVVNDRPDFIHLRLVGMHFTPYMPVNEIELATQTPAQQEMECDSYRDSRQSEPGMCEQAVPSEATGLGDTLDDTMRHESTAAEIESAVRRPRKDEAMARYLVAEARPPRAKPPWPTEDDDVGIFSGVQTVNDHPFAYRTNLVYFLSADCCLDTEVLTALAERQFINVDQLLSTKQAVG